MKYEPFDVPYLFTLLGAERSAMLWHQASFATKQMGRYGAPLVWRKILKTQSKRADLNCPPALLTWACGATAPRRPTRLAGEQFRRGQTIHISSKVL